jgi:HAD superfamily hydrolase (TIGR01549 family)
MPIRGVIFDLDGTLIDSQLDFDAMRREMEFEPGRPILETIESLADPDHQSRCHAILRRHEQEGARRATLISGAQDLLDELSRRDIPQAILTRNSREMTELTLQRLGLRFPIVVAREDAPPKPDPAGLLHICRVWNIPVTEALFVGDFHFDLLAGNAAGIATVLFAPDTIPAYAADAYCVIKQLGDLLLDQRINFCR